MILYRKSVNTSITTQPKPIFLERASFLFKKPFPIRLSFCFLAVRELPLAP